LKAAELKNKGIKFKLSDKEYELKFDNFTEKWKNYLKSDNLLQRYKAKQFIEIISSSEIMKEFDMDLFFRIVEKMTVFEGKRVIVSLLDGTEIEVIIE